MTGWTARADDPCRRIGAAPPPYSHPCGRGHDAEDERRDRGRHDITPRQQREDCPGVRKARGRQGDERSAGAEDERDGAEQRGCEERDHHEPRAAYTPNREAGGNRLHDRRVERHTRHAIPDRDAAFVAGAGVVGARKNHSARNSSGRSRRAESRSFQETRVNRLRSIR